MKPIEQNQSSISTVPYPPSYLDRFMHFTQRLPVPYWLIYLLLFILQSLITYVLAWVDGSISVLTTKGIL